MNKRNRENEYGASPNKELNAVDVVIIKLHEYYDEYLAEVESQELSASEKVCPRCGMNHLSGDPVMDSTSELSSMDYDFYICNDCAWPDKFNKNLDDLLKWWIADQE